MENVYGVANYIKSKGNFTDGKVQKILYYAYSVYLVKNNDKYSENMKKLFDGKFLAFPNGPLEAHMYIDKLRHNLNKNNSSNLNSNIKEKQNEKFLDKIIAVFGKYSEHRLEEMTKGEEPWLKPNVKLDENIPSCAKVIGIIKDETIYDYYKDLYGERIK